MTKPSKSAARHQELFGRVMAAWAEDGDNNPGTRGLLSSYLDNFPGRHDIGAILKGSPPTDLLHSNVWVVGRPVHTHEENLFPVASAGVKIEKGFIMGTVRVALLQGENRPLVRASGLRFESAEERADPDDPHAVPKPHTYPHSQPCRSWSTGGICLLHPFATVDRDVDNCPDCFMETVDDLKVRTDHFNIHRPAVPLRCRTLPGLAVTALAALYGAVVAREILDTVNSFASSSGCPVEVVEDIEHILGEDDAAGFPA